MKLPIFTEEEFIRLLETGEGPDRFEKCNLISSNAASERLGSHNDPIDLDHLTKEYVLRQLYSLFGRKRIPRKQQARIIYAILDLAEMQGLVVEQDPIDLMRSFISTQRLAKYWSRIYVGEPLSAGFALADEYKRLVNDLDNESISSAISLVSEMFRMLQGGWVENGGRTASGIRLWHATEKAWQLGAYYHIKRPLGRLSTHWDWQPLTGMDGIIRWYVDFLYENLLEGPKGPLVELVGDDDPDKCTENFVSELSRFLVQSGFAEVVWDLSENEKQELMVATDKCRRKSKWLLSGREPTDRKTKRYLSDVISQARAHFFRLWMQHAYPHYDIESTGATAETK